MIEGALDPITNRQSWTDQCEVRDEDDVLINLDDAVIVFEVQDDDGTSILSATTDNGKITIDGDGVFSFSFTLDEVRTLCAPKTYNVGCTIELNGNTEPYIRGTIAVLDGNVS